MLDGYKSTMAKKGEIQRFTALEKKLVIQGLHMVSCRYVFPLICLKPMYPIVFDYFLNITTLNKRDLGSLIYFRDREFRLFITTQRWLW